MDIQSVGAYVSDRVVQNKKTNEEQMQKSSNGTQVKVEDQAVVFEKSDFKEEKTYSKDSKKVDAATIEKLKKEAEQRTEQLRSIVERLLLKQSKTLTNSMDIYSIIKNGEVEVDEETRLQAQKDIAEDGYWGVEQTSERMVSFAKALAGNDPEKADAMIEAFEEGYAMAQKQWGGELPSICKDTRDAFLKKMEDWKSSSEVVQADK